MCYGDETHEHDMHDDHARQVAIEIRAAELADVETSHATMIECKGWNDASVRLLQTENSDEYMAGWLAHEIYSHEDS